MERDKRLGNNANIALGLHTCHTEIRPEAEAMGKPTDAAAGLKHRWQGGPRGASTAQGFTLLELMITAVILSLLTALAFPRYQQARSSALIGSIVAELVANAKACSIITASGFGETPTPPPVTPERGGVELLQGCSSAGEGGTLQASWGSARASGIACLSSTSLITSSTATVTVATDSSLTCSFAN